MSLGALIERSLKLLRSPRFAVLLLIGIAGLSVAGTVFSPAEAARFYRDLLGPGLLPAARAIGLVDTYHSPLFVALVVLLSLSVILCTERRILHPPRLLRSTVSALARLRLWSDLILHLSLVAILTGGAGNRLLGFAGTQYLLLGKTEDTVFDVAREVDVPLGFTLLLRDWEESYYPVRTRIGVRDTATDEKIAFLEIMEGQKVKVPGRDLHLAIEGYDPEGERVLLTAWSSSEKNSFALETKPGGKTTFESGGLGFVLVAYNRELKNVRNLITIIEDGRALETTWLGPNETIRHRGTNLFQTAWGEDPYKNRMVGLQVIRDPTAPIFWGGCILLSLSLPLLIYIRLRRTGRS